MSVPSFATNWKYLGTDTQETMCYIDKDSIHYYKDYAEVWEKRILQNGTETVILLRVTTNKKLAVVQAIEYDKNGDVTFSSDYYYYPSYSMIIPDSIGEAVYIAVYYS